MGYAFLLLTPIAAIFAAVVYAYAVGYGMRPKDFPPGPQTLPIIGNLHQMPLSNLHLKLQGWAKQYGPIMSLKLGSQDLIVVNSGTVVRELLDKRSRLYSGRMDVFVREFGDDLNILMKDNDEVWRRQRKMYHLRLNVNVADKYIPYQEFETSQLLHDILNNPEEYQRHVQRFTTSLASTIIYGWRTTSVELPRVKLLFEWIEGYSVAASRLLVMDWWPRLRPLFRKCPPWISRVSKELDRIKNLEDNLWMELLEDAKKSIASGSAKSSFCIDMILNNDLKSDGFLTDRQLAHNAGHGWAGAADTTLNTLLGFIKAMTYHPEVQIKAREELDRVVGSDRLPSWNDWDDLLYIRCVMKETLRWFPTTILGGMPHRLSADNVYDEYRLPANAGVMINVWAINNSSERVQRPRNFDPSRYEGDMSTTAESAALGDASKRDHFTFGAGRRICPGIHVAERSLFITISRLLWPYEISPALGLNGKPIPIDPDKVTPGFIVSPPPFRCSFKPQSQQKADLIEKTWNACQKDLDNEGNYNEEFYARPFGTQG